MFVHCKWQFAFIPLSLPSFLPSLRRFKLTLQSCVLSRCRRCRRSSISSSLGGCTGFARAPQRCTEPLAVGTNLARARRQLNELIPFCCFAAVMTPPRSPRNVSGRDNRNEHKTCLAGSAWRRGGGHTCCIVACLDNGDNPEMRNGAAIKAGGSNVPSMLCYQCFLRTRPLSAGAALED